MEYMKYFKWLEKIFFKKDYDFTRPDSNLLNFHPQMHLILASMGVFFTEGSSLIRLIYPCICIIMACIAIILETMIMLHGVQIEDLSLSTESFCFLMMLNSVPLIYFGILKQFLDKQLRIWQLYIVWMALICLTGLLFMLFPLVILNYQSMFARQDEHTVRPLAVTMWLPHDDAYRTPNYELFLAFELSLSIKLCQAFGGYVYLLFHSLLHCDTMMDMIILDFQVIFDGLDESVLSLPKQHPSRIEVKRVLQKRLERIVTWHASVFRALSTVSSVFGPPLAYQVAFSSIIICLVAFQFVKKLDDGVFDVLFFCLLVVGFVQLWIPCYLGTLLRNKGFAIGDSCFNCRWNETSLGQLIGNDILIIIARSQIPMYIKFTGLPNLQLETYSSIMTSAYSYFNMLRQYTD